MSQEWGSFLGGNDDWCQGILLLLCDPFWKINTGQDKEDFERVFNIVMRGPRGGPTFFYLF